jgi:outer membrane protein
MRRFKLDSFSILWQQEIDQKQAAMDKMFKDYDAEQVMLPDALKKKREDELLIKKKNCGICNAKAFGFEGDLFKKRQELIKPIQDKVYNAVQKLAVENNMTSFSIKVKELPLSLPTQNWIKAKKS